MLLYCRKAAYGLLNERYGCLEFIWLLDDKGEKASHEQIRDFESNGVGPLSEVVDDFLQEEGYCRASQKGAER